MYVGLDAEIAAVAGCDKSRAGVFLFKSAESAMSDHLYAIMLDLYSIHM
jgi:hypothetical protein